MYIFLALFRTWNSINFKINEKKGFWGAQDDAFGVKETNKTTNNVLKPINKGFLMTGHI